MKSVKLFLAAILSAASALSCTGLEPDRNPADGGGADGESVPIRFTKLEVSGTQPLTEAKIGLTIGSPVNVRNVLVNVDGVGNITPETDLYWAPEQTSASRFTAYLPYNPSYGEQQDNLFTVSADQSAAGAVLSSRLMVATASAKPSDPSVSLTFNDRMAALDLWFDNRSGKAIKEVYVRNVYLGVILDVLGGECVTEKSSPSDIKMCDPYGKAVKGLYNYSAVLPPQTTDLTIDVVFADGSIQTCPFGSELSLEARVYHTDENPIILTGDGSEAGFTVSVRDWTYGGSISFDSVPHKDDITMDISVSDITYQSASVTFTPSTDDEYYYYSVYNTADLDNYLKTWSIYDILYSDIVFYRENYEEEYGLETLLSLICNKGRTSVPYSGLAERTGYSVISCFVDGNATELTGAARVDFTTAPRPDTDRDYAKALGTYTFTAQNLSTPATVRIEENIVNESYLVSFADVTPVSGEYYDTFDAEYDASSKSVRIRNHQFGSLGFFWNFRDVGMGEMRLDISFPSSNTEVNSLILKPDTSGSTLAVSTEPAIPAGGSVSLIGSIFLQGAGGEPTETDYYYRSVVFSDTRWVKVSSEASVRKLSSPGRRALCGGETVKAISKQ